MSGRCDCLVGFFNGWHLPGQESQWDRDETGNDQNRDNSRSGTNDLVAVWVVQAKGLKQTPQTVVQVQSDDDHGDDVKQ